MLFLTVLSMATPQAQAKDILHVAAHHSWSAPMSRNSGEMGRAFGVDVGYGKGIGVGKIIPEIGLGIGYDRGVLVPRAGMRAILGWVVTPGAYAHVNTGLGAGLGGAIGFDAGLSVDVSLPLVRAGAFAGMQVFGGSGGSAVPDQNWVAGIEVALALPKKD